MSSIHEFPGHGSLASIAKIGIIDLDEPLIAFQCDASPTFILTAVTDTELAHHYIQ